jgi:hypothetical protein
MQSSAVRLTLLDRCFESERFLHAMSRDTKESTEPNARPIPLRVSAPYLRVCESGRHLERVEIQTKVSQLYVSRNFFDFVTRNKEHVAGLELNISF